MSNIIFLMLKILNRFSLLKNQKIIKYSQDLIYKIQKQILIKFITQQL
jgi:hypothetical protein